MSTASSPKAVPAYADESAPAALTTPRWLPAAAWTTLAIVVAFLAARHWRNPPYTPESWSYYELAKSVGSDFLRTNTYRNYQTPIAYGSSFGPVWPVATWAMGALTRTGVHAGFVAAMACVGASAAALEAYGRRVVGLAGFGPMVMIWLLAFSPYANEVIAAGSFPLTVLLLSVLLWTLSVIQRRSVWTAFGVGGLAAGMVLTRTDTLLAVLLFAVALLAARRLRWWQALSAGVAFAIVMVPWALYGLAHFGTPMVADNKIIAAAAQTRFSTDVIDVDRIATFTDAPLGWLGRIGGNVPLVVLAWGDALIRSPAALCVILAGLLLLCRNRFADSRWPLLPIIAGTCFSVEIFVAQLTTRYLERRYLTCVVVLALIVALGLILRGRIPVAFTGPASGRAVVLALILVPTVSIVGYHTETLPVHDEMGTLTGGAVEQELRRCHNATSTLVIAGTGVAAFRHGALTGLPTGVTPRNLTDLPAPELRKWIKDYRIGQFYLPPTSARFGGVPTDEAMLSALTAAATLTPDPCAQIGKLFRVEATTG